MRTPRFAPTVQVDLPFNRVSVFNHPFHDSTQIYMVQFLFVIFNLCFEDLLNLAFFEYFLTLAVVRDPSTSKCSLLKVIHYIEATAPQLKRDSYREPCGVLICTGI